MTVRGLVVVCVLTAVSPAYADDVPDEGRTTRLSIGLSESVLIEHDLGVATNLEVGARIDRRFWIDAAFSFGGAGLYEPAGSGEGGDSLIGGSVGASYLRCRRTYCWGVRSSLGYQRVRIEFSDGLLDPPEQVDRRHTVFGEARLLTRLRIVGILAIEASLAARVHVPTVDTDDSGIGPGVVGSIGVHVTL